MCLLISVSQEVDTVVIVTVTADLGKIAKRDACRPPHRSCAMIRGNMNWLLSSATAHEQRADNARPFLRVSLKLQYQ